MPFHKHHYQCCYGHVDSQYYHRSLGCCRLELSTANPCRRHLHFHTVGYDYEYVHLFTFCAASYYANHCAGSPTFHTMIGCHRKS
ncbi:hypothetical protein Hanom_Chr13g01202211 [Helianthus anomalus]